MNNFEGKTVDIETEKYIKYAKRIIPIVLILIFAIVLLLNSVYVIENKENGVVLRFGTVSEEVTQAGLHFKIPFIDTVEKVDVKTVYTMEYGYSVVQEATTYSEAVYATNLEEATVIVDGANNNASIALIEVIIQYKKSRPVDYLFKVDDPEGTLRLALEDVIRTSVQSFTLDEAKTEKERIDETILPALQKRMDDYESGIEITSVKTQNVSFLDNVEAAYQEKENANQYKNSKQEDAERYYNTIIPQANAEAIQLVEEANSYKAQVIANANAGVAEFNALYTEYLNNPAILKEKYYIESMGEFLVNNNVVIDATNDGDIYKFYNFDENDVVKQEITENE
jgi:membrane protease subunit HflK